MTSGAGLEQTGPGWPDDIEAMFTPRRTDDLRERAAERIGQTTTWSYAGVVDFDSPYEGQRQWIANDHEWRTGWVPECDLTILSSADSAVSS